MVKTNDTFKESESVSELKDLKKQGIRARATETKYGSGEYKIKLYGKTISNINKRKKPQKRGEGRSKQSKFLTQKILSKPKAKVPSYSATKVIKQLASEQGALVREVEPKEIVNDDRSLFFNKEFTKEKKETNKWLS